MAGAGVDEHHGFLDGFTLSTLELYLRCLGAVGGAATPVRTHTTVPGLVGQHAGAVLIAEPDGFHRLPHPQALASSLRI